MIRAFISALPTRAALSVPVDLLRFFQIYDFRPARREIVTPRPPPSRSFYFFFTFNRLSLVKGRRELSSHRVNSAPDMRNWDLSWVDDRRHALKQGHVEQLNIHGLGREKGRKERETVVVRF